MRYICLGTAEATRVARLSDGLIALQFLKVFLSLAGDQRTPLQHIRIFSRRGGPVFARRPADGLIALSYFSSMQSLYSSESTSAAKLAPMISVDHADGDPLCDGRPSFRSGRARATPWHARFQHAHLVVDQVDARERGVKDTQRLSERVSSALTGPLPTAAVISALPATLILIIALEFVSPSGAGQSLVALYMSRQSAA